MSVRNDECLSKILLQLKFQAIILKDYWPLKGPVRSHVFFSPPSVFASAVFVFIRENNWKLFPCVLEGINTDRLSPAHFTNKVDFYYCPSRWRLIWNHCLSSQWPTHPLHQCVLQASEIHFSCSVQGRAKALWAPGAGTFYKAPPNQAKRFHVSTFALADLWK